jgi:hypothetical protein
MLLGVLTLKLGLTISTFHIYHLILSIAYIGSTPKFFAAQIWLSLLSLPIITGASLHIQLLCISSYRLSSTQILCLSFLTTFIPFTIPLWPRSLLTAGKVSPDNPFETSIPILLLCSCSPCDLSCHKLQLHIRWLLYLQPRLLYTLNFCNNSSLGTV